MSQVRRTRIVCTIGPSSISPQVMRSMIQSGMDVARLNFSHGDPDTHREAAANVREASEAVGRPVALLGDLQGPKIRTGTVEGTFQKLVRGRTIELVVRAVEDGRAEASVVRGGLLGERKGVSVPGRPLALPALTDKDLEDLRLAVELGVDYLALSFVRRPEDLLACRRHLSG